MTLLTNNAANSFFRMHASDFALGSDVLESALRYIAITHRSGDIESVVPIKVEKHTFSNPSSVDINYVDGDASIFVFESRGGAELPRVEVEGWVSLDSPPFPVAPFLSKFSQTSVYVNSETKKTVMFVKRISPKWIDGLCSSLFRILPAFYPEGYELTDGEKALFTAAHNRDENAFTETVNALGATIDFRSLAQGRVLIGWADHIVTNQIANAEAEANSLTRNIRDYENSLSELYTDLANRLRVIDSLRSSMRNGGDDSLHNFFKTHKQLSIINTRTSRGIKYLTYGISETVEYFDEDAFVRVYNNRASSFSEYATDEVREVCYAIFAKNRGSFRVEAAFNLENLSALTVAQNTRSGDLDSTHLPHPHLYHYGCLGGNRNEINAFMRDGDWDLAIEQSIAAVKNINFGDAIVIRSFVRDIRNYFNTCRCIIADNGSEMTPCEFLNYIRSTPETTNEGENING